MMEKETNEMSEWGFSQNLLTPHLNLIEVLVDLRLCDITGFLLMTSTLLLTICTFIGTPINVCATLIWSLVSTHE